MRILEAVKGPKGDGKNIEEYGCKMKKEKRKPYFSIDCGCNPKKWTLYQISPQSKETAKNESLRNHIRKICKKSAVNIELEFTIETAASESPYNWTELNLKLSGLQIVTTTQSHAMDIADLFAQIGGFFGLLIGASVMSLLEVVEFIIQSCYNFLKRMWQSRVVQISST